MGKTLTLERIDTYPDINPEKKNKLFKKILSTLIKSRIH